MLVGFHPPGLVTHFQGSSFLTTVSCLAMLMKSVIDQIDLVGFALEKLVHGHAADGRDIREGRRRRQVAELGNHLPAPAHEQIPSLAPDGDITHRDRGS